MYETYVCVYGAIFCKCRCVSNAAIKHFIAPRRASSNSDLLPLSKSER